MHAPSTTARLPIVRETIATDLRRAPVMRVDYRDFPHADTLGGGDACLAGDDSVILIDKDRQRAPELSHRSAELHDLLFGVLAGIVGVSLEALDRAIFDWA